MLHLSSESILCYDLHYFLGSLLYILGTLLAFKKQTNKHDQERCGYVCVYTQTCTCALINSRVCVCVIDFKSFI